MKQESIRAKFKDGEFEDYLKEHNVCNNICKIGRNI